MTSLTELEKQVIRMLLYGEDRTLEVLRQQADNATVSSREFTGAGFFTEFAIPPEVLPVVGRPTFKLGDVNGMAANVKNGLGFLLYVTDGVLSMLEGYTYDEPWPGEVSNFALTYSTGKHRDMDILLKSIHNV